jgi:phosphodiesterase/alkaline phosphatase D-like protein
MFMRSKALLLSAALFVWAAIAFAQNQVQITQGPKVEHVGSNTAVIAWSTNVSAGSVVKYGTDPNNLTQTAQVPWGGITHRVTVKNLEPNKTYYFQALSGQAQGTGTQAMSSVSQFQTTGQNASATTPATPSSAPGGQPASGSAQVVAGPIPQHLTGTSATIWWETAQNAPVSVKYGTSPGTLNQTAQDTSGGGRQSHKTEISGLQPDTTYYVALVDASGNQVATSQFKTYPANYAKDKVVDITNGPVVEYISDREAVVAWSTTQKSSTMVKYGTDPNNLNQTAEAAWGAGGANSTHRVHLKNLQPNTKYWFEIQSGQAQGTNTMAQSPKYPFQTVANASAALRINQQR